MQVAIVGAGVTGCSCALSLAAQGHRVTVYEARTVGSGASGNNAGFALRGAGLSFKNACKQIGEQAAKELWLASELGLKRMEELAGEFFERTGSLRAAASDEECLMLGEEYEALSHAGFSVEWVESLLLPSGRKLPGGIFHPLDGTLNPRRWIDHLAAIARSNGAVFHEYRPLGFDEFFTTHKNADAIVIATDGYTQRLAESFPSLARLIQPIRNQVILTSPLSQRYFSYPYYYRNGFDYWQQLTDGRLIIGGRRDLSLESENTDLEVTTSEIQDALLDLTREVIGYTRKIERCWAGIFGGTPDFLPLVGQIKLRAPKPPSGGSQTSDLDNLWITAGYSGQGNVLGLVCGDIVAQQIMGAEANKTLTKIFDPNRK